MIASRITPRLVFFGLGLNLGSWLAVHIPAKLHWTPRHWIAESAIRTLALCTAYLLAFALNVKIASEYKNARWLRVAWLALAANAGLSVIRIIFESSLLNLIWKGYKSGPIYGMLQHLAIVPANACLLLGLLAMGWAYHRVGLGFKIEKRDYAAIGGILVLIISLLFFREGLTEARSPFAVSRYLQLIGLVLLSLSAAASLVLYRMALQMDGGKLAIALRLLTLYTLLRGVLVLLSAIRRLDVPELEQFVNFNSLFIELGWQIVPWVAALAAAYRVELTVHAAKELKEQRESKAALASVSSLIG